MKTVSYTRYICETCGKDYRSEQEANNCESIPIKYDKGVKIGDEVLITSGDGKGLRCKVNFVGVHQPGWGPKQYDHAVYLSGDVIDSWGSRQLSHDSYEVLK